MAKMPNIPAVPGMPSVPRMPTNQDIASQSLTNRIGQSLGFGGGGNAGPRFETGADGYKSVSQSNPYSMMHGNSERELARSQNAAEAERRYTSGLQGGKWSSDPYERAQQNRNFHQTADFKRFWNALDPATQLQERLGTGAYDFRKGLAETQANAANDIRAQAGSTLDQGIKKVRSGANNRGLLYSGLRQGAEQDYRGQVASTMAKQIAQSNADLSKKADSMDEIAANAKLQGMQQSMQAQAQVDKMNLENSVSRAQQMQQLTGAIGYGFGRWAGGGSEPARPSGAYGMRPDNGGY